MPSQLEPIIAQISLALQVIHNPDISDPMHGHSHDVYRLEYPNGQMWSLRIAKNEFAARLSRRGLNIMKYLKTSQPSLQIPTVIYEAQDYTVLEYLSGSPIGSWNTNTLSESRRHTLLDGFALFLFRLWSCPVLEYQTDAPNSYRDWLLGEVDKAISRSLHDSSWGDVGDFLCRRAKADKLVPPEDSTTVAIRHGDLNAWNVIADESGLSGIIDWDTAQLVPIPVAVQHPVFMANIPGYRNDNVPEDMSFQEDRKYLEDAIHKLAANSGPQQLLSDLLASSGERQFFELSLRNKRVNEKYVQLRLGNVVDKSAVREQLTEFLSANPTARDSPAIRELQNRLMPAL